MYCLNVIENHKVVEHLDDFIQRYNNRYMVTKLIIASNPVQSYYFISNDHHSTLHANNALFFILTATGALICMIFSLGCSI